MTLARYNDQVQRSVPRVDKWIFTITGAAAASPTPLNTAALITFGALTQDQIDAFLDSSSEFDYLAFDSTSMGADATGIILNYGGQISKLLSVSARCFSGTGGDTRVERACLASAALTNTTLATECAKSSRGNVGVKVDWGNSPDMDGLTSGIIELEVNYLPK